MWMLVSLLAIVASLALVLRFLRGFGEDWLSRAVILLIWFRFALTALGAPALRPVAAGQSLLALGTLAAVAALLMITPLHLLRLNRLLPFAAMGGVVLLSALLNGQAGALGDTAILWLMFTLIAVLVHRALREHGSAVVLASLLAVFSLPIGLQLAAFVMGRSIIGQDGSITYVGNYVHEAVFSTVALCAAWLVTIYPWKRKAPLLLAFAVVIFSIFVANYRTLILACLPLLVAVLARLGAGSARPGALPLRLGVALVLTLAVLPLLPSDRFAELGTVVGKMADLAKPAQEFTAAEKDMLSARIYIGAAYVERYLEADLLRHVIGFGPGADTRFVGTHPHNEYLRVLFESGLVGLGLWVGILIGLMRVSVLRAPGLAKIPLFGGYAALTIGALGTSFFIRPEGIIFIALLVATTWHLTEPRNVTRALRPEQGFLSR